MQHAVSTLPGPNGPSDGSASLDSTGVQDDSVYSSATLAGGQYLQPGADMYVGDGAGGSSYNQPATNNVPQSMWNQSSSMPPRPSVKQFSPRSAMNPAGMPMV